MDAIDGARAADRTDRHAVPDLPGASALPGGRDLPGRRGSTGRDQRGGAPGRWARRTTALFGACHPLPTAAVTLLAAGLAMAAGQDAAGCLLVSAAVLTGQLSVGWSNDAVDAARDTAAGRGAKPVVRGAVGARAVGTAALVALALCVPLSLAYGRLAGAVHLVGVVAAWAYNVRLKSTLLSWLPYAVGFAALPAFVTLGLPGQPRPAWWIVTAAALMGVGAHLGNVLPDIDTDLAQGVRGWPQRLGASRTRLLLPAPLLAATALLVLGGPPGAFGAAAVAVALVAGAGGALMGRHRPRLPFLAAILVAGVDVTLLLRQGTALS
ncbi:UbiA family prenyltransferase [Streptomyces sp. NPDC002018]|uniref:UbiA family prenyltransferase n=1 Tax=Streptomyces sp. NPDC002018 TaxID=3364629 RepID=UPI00369839F7